MMSWWWALILIVPIAAWIGGAISVSAKGREFAELGDIRGRPIAEIIKAVGPPSAISAIAPDQTLYQWQGIIGFSSFHYAIAVDALEAAIGYTHQSQS